jgi:hypothetical protein
MASMDRELAALPPESASHAVRPAAVPLAPNLTPAATILQLQRSAGNAAVARALLQRDDAPAPPVPAQTPTSSTTAGATVGKVGGTRPVPKNTSKTFENCQAAVDWINSGVWTGEAEPIYKPTVGTIKKTKQADGTWKAEADVTWAYDPTSKAEVIVPTWPKMTDAEKAAVQSYKAALTAHEVMHFDVTDAVIKALPKTITATGSDESDAFTNLKAEAETYLTNAQSAIDTATHDYDDKTDHGKNQAAVGGDNVHLACP